MNPILECQGLSKQYKNFYALNNLNLSLEKGQIVNALFREVFDVKEINQIRPESPEPLSDNHSLLFNGLRSFNPLLPYRTDY